MGCPIISCGAGIGGFGYVASFTRLPEWLAWECFGEGNGAASLEELSDRLGNLRDRNELRGSGGPSQIGCIVLVQAVFFPPDKWIPQPTDWAARNLRYKRYDLSEPYRDHGRASYVSQATAACT